MKTELYPGQMDTYRVTPETFTGKAVEVDSRIGGARSTLIGTCIGTEHGCCLVDFDGAVKLIPAHHLSRVVFRQKRIRTREKILEWFLKFGLGFVSGMLFGVLFSEIRK